MIKIGFVGLGTMGRPMAANLLKAGYELHLKSGRSVPQDLVEAGGRSCSSARDVAAAADIVVLMLPDAPEVEEVLFADQGVAQGLSAGKMVIDMSSISPVRTRDFAGRINELGCDYLDAPVSGGEVGARSGTLTIMVGGPVGAFERARPLFEIMGKNITLVGDNGAGQITKVANQIIVALNIEAVAEALVFASKAGADPARVRQALMGGFAASRVLEVHGERMVQRTFEPGFRIELHQKDLNIALESGRALGVPMPNTANTQQLFSLCGARDGKGWDHSALVKALETMAAHEIA